MDCMEGVRIIEAAWTAMPWSVTSVEQQTTRQDQGKPSTQRPGGGGVDVFT